MRAAGDDREVLHLEHDLARRSGLFLHVEVDVAADHHGGQRLGRGVLGFDRADVLALAQDGAAVGDGHDLVELVGDEEDALPFRREILHDLHELVDLLRREHRGGLVEDEDLVVAIEHLEDLGTLLHTDGDVLDDRVRIDLQAVFLRELEHLLAGLVLAQEAAL